MNVRHLSIVMEIEARKKRVIVCIILMIRWVPPYIFLVGTLRYLALKAGEWFKTYSLRIPTFATRLNMDLSHINCKHQYYFSWIEISIKLFKNKTKCCIICFSKKKKAGVCLSDFYNENEVCFIEGIIFQIYTDRK